MWWLVLRVMWLCVDGATVAAGAVSWLQVVYVCVVLCVLGLCVAVSCEFAVCCVGVLALVFVCGVWCWLWRARCGRWWWWRPW